MNIFLRFSYVYDILPTIYILKKKKIKRIENIYLVASTPLKVDYLNLPNCKWWA